MLLFLIERRFAPLGSLPPHISWRRLISNHPLLIAVRTLGKNWNDVESDVLTLPATASSLQPNYGSFAILSLYFLLFEICASSVRLHVTVALTVCPIYGRRGRKKTTCWRGRTDPVHEIALRASRISFSAPLEEEVFRQITCTWGVRCQGAHAQTSPMRPYPLAHLLMPMRRHKRQVLGQNTIFARMHPFCLHGFIQNVRM